MNNLQLKTDEARESGYNRSVPFPESVHRGYLPRFLRQQGVRWLLLLIFGEVLLLSVSLNLAMYIRYFFQPQELLEVSRHLAARSLIFAAIIMLGMAAMGQYQVHLRTGWFGLLARQGMAFILGAFGLVVAYYMVPQAYVGRGVLAIAMLLGFVLVAGYRSAFMRLVEVDAFKRRVLILGAGRRAASIHNNLRRRTDRRGFRVVGFVPCPGETLVLPEHLLANMSMSFSELLWRERVDEIVVAVDERRGGLPMDALLECRQLGIAITDLTTFFERESGRVQLELTDPSWLVFSGGFNATPLSKRCFDLGIASLVLLLTWPFMLLVALAIRIESGSGQPILYRQQRVGAYGKAFWLLKFRSMRTDAESDGKARWASENDNRVTRVGRFIRKVRLDELPQLWNVFKGDMSFIGPRPERPQFVADLAGKIRYYDLRHCLKPGLAGWAQLRYAYGASEEDAAEKLKYDLFYVKNHSLLFDLMILIQTVEVILFRRGAR